MGPAVPWDMGRYSREVVVQGARRYGKEPLARLLCCRQGSKGNWPGVY